LACTITPSDVKPQFRITAFARAKALGTSNVTPLVVGGQLNPRLAERGIRVIVDTHGRTSHLSAGDVDALSLYLKSLQK
jgi:hypothetical protein